MVLAWSLRVKRYVEFACVSNFSFLRGASHPEELILQAHAIGLAGLGLCDRNSVAGVVRAHLAKREHKLGLNYHPGARLVFKDGTPDILAYPRDRAAWGRLTRLLTTGNTRGKKGACILYLEDLIAHNFGLELIAMGGDAAFLDRVHSQAPGRVRLAASMLYQGRDRARLAKKATLAREAQVPLIAINDVIFHHPDRRELADVLTCIREKVTIDRAGRRLMANAERFLKPPEEMERLFKGYLAAIKETEALSEKLTFSLKDL
jgi:error-prone DNA polymerase